MRKVSSYLAALYLLLNLLSTTSSAQGRPSDDLCQNVLNLAFYDRTMDIDDSKQQLASRAWACSATQEHVAHDFDLGLNIPLPQNPSIIVGGKVTDASRRDWSQNNCSDQSLQTADEHYKWGYHEILSRYMGDAIQAWESCMSRKKQRSTELPFTVTLDRENSDEYFKNGRLTLRVEGKTQMGRLPPQVKLKIQGANCPDNPGWIAAEKVAQGAGFRCWRTQKEGSCPNGRAHKGFEPFLVDVAYTDEKDGLIFKDDKGKEQRAYQDVLAELPGVDPTCDCGDGLVTDFEFDQNNCGACGRACGNGPSSYGKCRQNACSICEFGMSDGLKERSQLSYSCSMRPNARVGVSITGSVRVPAPTSGGDVINSRDAVGELNFLGHQLPITDGRLDNQKIPGEWVTWNDSTDFGVQLDSTGFWEGVFHMSMCFYGEPRTCDARAAKITVKERD